MEVIARASHQIAALIDQSQLKIPKNDVSPDTLPTLLGIFFQVTGGVAVIVLIIAGIRFIISRGDPQATAKARNTILYAALGLAISLSATVLVKFVTDKL